MHGPCVFRWCVARSAALQRERPLLLGEFIAASGLKVAVFVSRIKAPNRYDSKIAHYDAGQEVARMTSLGYYADAIKFKKEFFITLPSCLLRATCYDKSKFTTASHQTIPHFQAEPITHENNRPDSLCRHETAFVFGIKTDCLVPDA